MHALRRNVDLKILLFQQQDLWIDEGTVFTDLRNRQGDEIDTSGLDGLSPEPNVIRDGRGSHICGTNR